MKKTLVSIVALMMALPVMAAEDCAYSPLQNLIRNVRSVNEITELMNKGVIFSEEPRCGGSLMQLAVLRGNPQVLEVLLKQDPARANEMVDLSSYPIPGAPKRIPLILFASYYAPNEQMIQILYNTQGTDISKTDERGRNLLWYMDQNPVLRNTQLYDYLNKVLLSSLVPTQQNRQVIPVGGQQQQQAGIKMPGASVVEAKEN